eukprot:TRINITY_DN15067_c0_g1::TRINITY_DN15067_c0_g1_i1::g.24978::m.24978 TRINITY_DN15067_c0_g1::TRINITY_DN15067_c0_g1_i1::g.24978  ORF type:complete len:165 (-),score=10.84,LAMTOR/PF15454.1/1.1,LAMTOR/PF15454.1/27,DUF4156/PF13698.1/0.15 TRINITY_DN15067_c0_g1_i1:4-498(-)
MVVTQSGDVESRAGQSLEDGDTDPGSAGHAAMVKSEARDGGSQVGNGDTSKGQAEGNLTRILKNTSDHLSGAGHEVVLLSQAANFARAKAHVVQANIVAVLSGIGRGLHVSPGNVGAADSHSHKHSTQEGEEDTSSLGAVSSIVQRASHRDKNPNFAELPCTLR